MDEILDVAHALFLRRGYANTSVQAIIDEVGVAKGCFYHHYRSKSELLDGLAARMVGHSIASIQPLVDDPHMGALDKLRGLFSRIIAWKAEHREALLRLMAGMNQEGNAALRQRFDEAGREVAEPLLTAIIEQGVAEGVFHTTRPRPTAHIVLGISQSQSRCFQRRLLSPQRGPEVEAELTEELLAHYDAIERVLQAPPGSLCVLDPDTLAQWLAVQVEQS